MNTTTSTDDLLLQGLVHYSRGEEDLALRALTALLEVSPLSPLAATTSAQILIARSEFRQAARVARLALVVAPEDAEVHYLLGAALRGQHLVYEAVPCFREALRLQPGHRRAGLALDEILNVQEP